MAKTVKFGQVPIGFAFRFPGEIGAWYVGADRVAFSFEEDGETVIRCHVGFNCRVIVG